MTTYAEKKARNAKIVELINEGWANNEIARRIAYKHRHCAPNPD